MPVARIDSDERQSVEAAVSMVRSLGEDPVPAPGHSTAHAPADYRQVNGWGADLDPANRPSFPKALPSTVTNVRGDVKHWQTPHMKVHLSNEHPNLTPAFGTSCPPHGLSGMLRDYAYEFGEATNRHWMTLMLADRIDRVESMIGDALQGRPDNYVREKGWSALFTYADRRKQFVMAGAAALGLIAVGLALKNAFDDND
jgi:hypothetical protein